MESSAQKQAGSGQGQSPSVLDLPSSLLSPLSSPPPLLCPPLLGRPAKQWPKLTFKRLAVDALNLRASRGTAALELQTLVVSRERFDALVPRLDALVSHLDIVSCRPELAFQLLDP